MSSEMKSAAWFAAIIVASVVVLTIFSPIQENRSRPAWASIELVVLEQLGGCSGGTLYLVEYVELDRARSTWCGHLLRTSEPLPATIRVRVWRVPR